MDCIFKYLIFFLRHDGVMAFSIKHPHILLLKLTHHLKKSLQKCHGTNVYLYVFKFLIRIDRIRYDSAPLICGTCENLGEMTSFLYSRTNGAKPRVAATEAVAQVLRYIEHCTQAKHCYQCNNITK